MTTIQLFQLSTNPIALWFIRRRLRAEIYAMHQAAKYFAEQEKSGQLGQVWAHKRQALLRSELNCLR